MRARALMVRAFACRPMRTAGTPQGSSDLSVRYEPRLMFTPWWPPVGDVLRVRDPNRERKPTPAAAQSWGTVAELAAELAPKLKVCRTPAPCPCFYRVFG